MSALVATAVVLLGAAAKKSNNESFLIILVVIVFAGYFLFLRPQQQKQRKARQQSSSVEVGDEILTVGGIVARVVDVTDDRITVVTGAESQGIAAVGSEPTRLVLVKQAIARKIEPVVADPDVDEDGHPVGGDHEDAGGPSFDHQEFGHDESGHPVGEEHEEHEETGEGTNPGEGPGP